MRNRIRKHIFLAYGLICVFYVLFSRTLYNRLYSRYRESWPLPVPYDESLVIQPWFLWGMLAIGIGMFFLFLILIDRYINWNEFRSLVMIAAAGFLLDVVIVRAQILYPPREGNVRLFIQYILCGAVCIGMPLLLRFLGEVRRRRENRINGSE